MSRFIRVTAALILGPVGAIAVWLGFGMCLAAPRWAMFIPPLIFALGVVFIGFGLACIALAYVIIRGIWEPPPTDPSSATPDDSSSPARIAPAKVVDPMAVLAVISLLSLGLIFRRFWNDISLQERQEHEYTTLMGLNNIRWGLNKYRDDMSGRYPPDPRALAASGKYIRRDFLKDFPEADPAPRHGISSQVLVMTNDGYKAGKFTDAGGWAYVIGGTTNTWDGTILVNCTHTDSKGTVWTSY